MKCHTLSALCGLLIAGTLPGSELKIKTLEDPWENHYSILAEQGREASEILLSGAKNEIVPFSVKIENSSGQMIFAAVKLHNAPPGTEYREAVHLREFTGTVVADALPELSRDRMVAVPPKGFALLWFNIPAVMPENSRNKMILSVANAENGNEVSVPVELKILPFTLPSEHPLNILGWDSSLLRTTGEKQEKMRTLLSAYGFNTWHIYDFAPAEFTSDGTMSAPPDFRELDRILIPLKKHSRMVLLRTVNAMLGLRDRNGKTIALFSDPWKKAYRQWLNALVVHLKTIGYSYEDFAIYPFDEYTEEKYIRFAEATREIDPKISIYGNPATDPARHFEMLLDRRLIDIAQAHITRLKDFEKVRPKAERLLKKYWYYECPVPHKSLSPSEFYRRIPWIAHHYRLDGIGFWTVTGMLGDDSAWDDFSKKPNRSSAIYENGDNIIPSRRLEAFRAGWTDYLYLAELKRLLKNGEGNAAARAEAETLLKKQNETMQYKSPEFMKLRAEIASAITKLKEKSK